MSMPPPSGQRFNPPPGWPAADPGWTPPPGWQPPTDWPPAPPGWQWYVPIKRRSWVGRHKVLTGLAAAVVLIVVLGAIGAAGTPKKPDATGTRRPPVSPPVPSASALPTLAKTSAAPQSPVPSSASAVPTVVPSQAPPSVTADLYHAIPQADGAAVIRYMSNAYGLTVQPAGGAFTGGEADGGNGATTSLTVLYNTSADGQTFEIECDYVGQTRTSAEVAAFMGDCAAHITYSGAKPTVAQGWVMQTLAAQHSTSRVLTIGSATFEIPASAAPTLTRLDVHGPPA